MQEKLKQLQAERRPLKLIENRTVFGGEDTEFSIYDTYETVDRVALSAPNPLYCGMVTGKKIIHLEDTPAFDFLPGESLVVPEDEEFYIDFPEATLDTPTKCLTVEIDCTKVQEIVGQMNERMARSEDSGAWCSKALHHLHVSNPDQIEQVVAQLVHVFTENIPYRDQLIDLKVTELVIRMLQSDAVKQFLENSHLAATNHGISHAMQYVKENLDRTISIDELARKAYMSKSSLFRCFQNEFGMTPVQYINQLRIERACLLLRDPHNSVTDVCFMVGYSSVSYFITLFKTLRGITPKQFQAQARNLVPPPLFEAEPITTAA